jgi:hypothetical protein
MQCCSSDARFFWLNTKFPWLIRLPTLPTWPLGIFGCCPNSKCRWQVPDLSKEKTRQPSWTWFDKKLSRNVSSNGRTARRSVCITNETTLRGIRVSDIQIINCIFADQRFDTFWTDHLYHDIVWQIFTYRKWGCKFWISVLRLSSVRRPKGRTQTGHLSYKCVLLTVSKLVKFVLSQNQRVQTSL